MQIHYVNTQAFPGISTKTFTPALVSTMDVERLIPGRKGEQYVLGMNGGVENPLQLIEPLINNALYGRWGMPNELVEAESFLTEPLTADTSDTIEISENVSTLLQNGALLLLLDDYPTLHEAVANMEVVLVTSYAGGLTATVQGFGATGKVKYNHAAGAIVQRVCPYPSSVGINGVPGVRTQEEQPTAVTNLALVWGTPTLTVTWTAHTNWMSAVNQGCVNYYDVFCLKVGQGITTRGPASGVKVTMLPSVADATPAITDGEQSVAVTQYYDQVTKTLTDLTAGTYIVYVYPKFGTGKTPASLFGRVSYKEIVIT